MKEELVSIITPMYNASRFIAQTIESVLAQTHPYWEMLIVNDGSKDNSYEIASGYSKKDKRIIILNQNNQGSATARNNGLRNARGKYICLLDADDLWEPCFLTEQIRFMKEKKASFVCGSRKVIDEDGNECLKPWIAPETATYKSLLKFNTIGILTAMYDREQLGLFFLKQELNSMRDDYVYWLEIIKKANIVYGNKTILGSARMVSNSVTSNKLKIIKPHFLVYYNIEKLGIIKSIYYTITSSVHSYIKRKRK